MPAVLDEHVDYLTLSGRYEAFSEALAKVVEPGDVVVDLGCGVGVLGLQALDAGASHVYGIDYSDAIELARESVARVGRADSYTCIRGSTFTAELPQAADLILCDHVGFFGFDYGIIRMLSDARARLLKPGGKVMPRLLRLNVAGASSSDCRTRMARWRQAPVPDAYHWISEYDVNAKHRYSFAAEELCTDPAFLGTIDLQQDVPEHFGFTAELTVSRDGSFDGLAGWFECELAEGVWMTNSPFAANRIERPNVFLACRESFEVKAGDTIKVSLRVRHETQTISWTITPPPPASRQKLSTWNATILAPADLREPATGPVSLNRLGYARKVLLDLVDGQRDALQIEEEIVAAYPDLFPSISEIRRFVRRELAAGTGD